MTKSKEIERLKERVLELEVALAKQMPKTASAEMEKASAHPDDIAVDALATAMKFKLAKQRSKGYGGWDTDCTQQRLSDLLRGHVDKGDPIDVANFCAFCRREVKVLRQHQRMHWIRPKSSQCLML